MIKEKLLTILGLKNTLATNINAKGVEASTTECMTTLVPKVSEIGGHITDEDIELAYD